MEIIGVEKQDTKLVDLTTMASNRLAFMHDLPH